FLYQVAQNFKIYYKSCVRCGFTGYFYHQFVIVTMIMWVVAFTKCLYIFICVPRRIVKPVRGTKMFFSKNRYLFVHFDFNNYIFLIPKIFYKNPWGFIKFDGMQYHPRR